MRVSRVGRRPRRGGARFFAIAGLALMLALAACGSQGTATVGTTAGGATTAAATTRAATTSATTTGATGAATRATATRGTASAAAGGGAAAAQRPPEGACTTAAASKPRPSGRTRLVIGTGGSGGVFYAYGGGLARIVTAKLPNTEMTAESTGGSVDNNKLVQKDDTYLGLTTADSGDEAVKGEGVYKDSGKAPICTIAVLYDSFLHVVALADSGVNSIADLKGKRVSVGSAGSSTEVGADRLMEAAGLNPKTDVQRDNLSVQESANAMKDKKIAAFFWIGGLPTTAVTELVTTGPKVKFLDTTALLKPLNDKFGAVYYPLTMVGTAYQGIPATPGIGVDNLLVVNATMSEQLVYDILKTLFDNQADVQGVHPEGKKFNTESAARVAPVPFHPGAIRYYREKGVYKP